MQKIYTRKRSKAVKNPFQSDNSSLLANPRLLVPVFAFLSILLTYSVLTTLTDSHTAATSSTSSENTHRHHHHGHHRDTFQEDDDDEHTKQDVNNALHGENESNNLLQKAKRSFFKGRKDKPPSIISSNYEFPQSSFKNIKDPNLKTMTFTLPSTSSSDPTKTTTNTFDAYVQPHISSFYNKNNPSMKPEKPRFQGEAGKFINLSKEEVHIYFGMGEQKQYIAHILPFQAAGTATYPGHVFVATPTSDPDDILKTFRVVPNENLYVYDPYYDEKEDKVMINLLEEEVTTKEERDMYWLQRNNLEFGKQYYEFTGREWLSLYPLKKPPVFRMWNADYFGQEHWILSKEKHYVKEPPANLLGPLRPEEFHQDVLDKNRHLKSYRGPGNNEYLNMTMKVLSCAPRVFEIKNFLSPVEVDHIVHMATGMKLSLSTTSGSDGSDRQSDTASRTSKNSWVGRNRSPIMDSIYRRAADLMQIDEAMLRRRERGERPDVKRLGTSAEQLQLVHYAAGEKYNPHHDFTYPDSHKADQPARFATLLLYLNEGMKGGETSFLKWVNAESSERLAVVPEIGKAVLFYSMLPDGNMDDLSQHAAEPVIEGEKWLINLWTWDPYLGFW